VYSKFTKKEVPHSRLIFIPKYEYGKSLTFVCIVGRGNLVVEVGNHMIHKGQVDKMAAKIPLPPHLSPLQAKVAAVGGYPDVPKASFSVHSGET
jgi:hypothetical protein